MLRSEISRVVNEKASSPAALVEELTVMFEAALAEQGVAGAPPAASWSGTLSVLSEVGLPLVPTFSGLEEEEDETTEDQPLLPTEEPTTLDRYVDVGPIGTGGMGEVRRVVDRDLGRTMAMKVIKHSMLSESRRVARFVEEAQATSQLQHPCIVPVHELGRLSDGRWYYTMQEVRGKTLTTKIREVHEASRIEGMWVERGGWSLRRLVDAFHKVCNALAYAHSRGVIHRDLKPDNIMVEDRGEMLVVDWGLAKVLGRPDLAAELGELDLMHAEVVSTDRSKAEAHATRMGQVAGTPAYMPPEQALGRISEIDRRSDVYALGAILYEILTGRRPYEGGSAMAVLEAVRTGPPEPVRERAHTGVPDDLIEACERAMERAREDRYQSADELAGAIQAWLDGSRRREQALAVVADAKERLSTAGTLRDQAKELDDQGGRLLEDIKAWEAEEKKEAGWAKQDKAARLRHKADLEEVSYIEGVQAALRIDPELPEAHELLVEQYWSSHKVAEVVRDRAEIDKAEALLVHQIKQLPEGHRTRQNVFAYLQGDGALSLVTDPPGAEVLLHRYHVKNRRLVPTFVRSLGQTPIVAEELPRGSYLCVLRKEGHADVHYPIEIGRHGTEYEHWDGVPPEGGDPTPIWLPTEGKLSPEDCYVPAGWFWSGGDPEAYQSLPHRRLWCDALIVKRFPLTNRDYLTFLDDLVAQGRGDEAERFAPRQRGGTESEQGPIIYGRTDDDRFVLRPDADGDVWDPDWPVTMVDWWCAESYAKWYAERTGRPWRLPAELEWEKAARGVDGRFFPWGNGFDPSWCCMLDSHPGRPLPAVVDTYPVDVSPYGIRGMGGNMRDWTGDEFDKEGVTIVDKRVGTAPSSLPAGSRRVVRGGSWLDGARYCRSALRYWYDPGSRNSNYGFRMFLGPVLEH